ncbi:MAG: DUF11 domain-containing protein [Oscillatoriales cyanobacterium RU_3_3]|nr:DUF11 domain-containing protein [Oscillatoriales cyanobacterium RU_3_3]
MVITDNLPTGLTGVIASDGGNYDPSTGIVTFPAIANLASGAGNTVTRTVSFVVPASGTVTNTASSTANTFDPNNSNNSGTAANARVTTTITPNADVVTTKTGPVSATPGATVTYTITSQNVGPSAAANVVITDTLPLGLTGVTASNGGTYNPATGVVTFPAIASLASGTGNAVTRTVSFPVPASGSVANTARSTAETPDPNSNNNNGTAANAQVTTAIVPVNQPPVALNANNAIAPSTTALLTGLGGTDPDGTVASFTINSLPPTAQGTVFLGDPASGGTGVTAGQILTPTQINQLFFRSTGAFAGASFTYSATDNLGLVSPATATVSAVLPAPNLPPVANNANISLPPNSTVNVAGLGASDPDGTIASFTINSLPTAAQGLLFLGNPTTGGTAITAGQILTPVQIQQIFFQSTAGFTAANFSYTATDNLGASAPASASVAAVIPTPGPAPTPAPVNRAPVANNASSTIAPSSTVLLTGLGGTDSDGTIASFTINSLPPVSQGLLFLGNPTSGGTAIVAGQSLAPADLDRLFFQSSNSFNGTNFTYTATDNLGLASSGGTVTVSAIVPPPNQPPTANNTNISLLANSAVNVTGLGGTDADGTIASFTINTLPPTSQGVLFLGNPTVVGTAITAGQNLTPAQIGQLFFQSTAGFSGANFSYSATDNRGATGLATAQIALRPSPTPAPAPVPANRAPITNNANTAIAPSSSSNLRGLGANGFRRHDRLFCDRHSAANCPRNAVCRQSKLQP